MTTRRPWLLPLVPVYGAALAIKSKLLEKGWLKRRRLPNPVISVGSVSVGGAGKTPVVLMMAEILRQRGYGVRILTRGYKRSSLGVARVEPFDDAGWHGDEPVLLAQRSEVPVFVGSDRYTAGVMAEQGEPSQQLIVHLLDDGFQHWQLARSFDIVLLTKEDVEDRLLPAGNLREPLSALRRADAVVLRAEEAAELRPFVEEVAEEEKKPSVWLVRRRLSLLEDAAVPETPTKLVAFCGIARPENFRQMLTAEGYEPVTMVTFADHHAYDEDDIKRLVETAQTVRANGFVTTEKDAVKLTPLLRDLLGAPVMIARLEVELVDRKEALDQLMSSVAELDRRKNRDRV